MSVVFSLKTSGYDVKNPVVEMEFATKPSDIFVLFPDNQPGIKELLFATDLFNEIDFLFAIAYGLFLIFFFVEVKNQTDKNFYILPIILSGVAILFDFLENWQLLTITKIFVSADIGHNLLLLQFFTWIKWSSLSVILLFSGFYAVQQKKLIFYVLAVLNFLPILLLTPAFINKTLAPQFAMLVVLSIVSLIVWIFFTKVTMNNAIK